ncbi:MAG: DUF4271 domain-containing protein [Bacteroidales bacterium]
MITLSPADLSSSPVHLNFSLMVLPSQDTLRAPVDDTLRAPVDDTLRVPVIDTLQLPVEDTLQFPVEDTLQFPVEDTLPVEESGFLDDSVAGPPTNDKQDTLQILPSDSLPDTSGTIWERIDATFFLDTSTNVIFHREHVFPSKEDHRDNAEDKLPVFLESGSSRLNSSSSAYKSYMESGQEEYVHEDAQYSTTWIPGMIILSFLLLTWIKLVYVQFLTPVLLSAFNYKEAFKLYCNKNAPTQNTFIILHFIFAINGGLFLFFVSRYFDFKMPDLNPPLLFLAASSFLIILFAAKSAAISVISFLFDKRKLFAEYKHNISLYTKIFGILLLPVIIGLLYADQGVHIALIYTGLAMGGIFYLLQLVRGLEIIVKKEFSLFYLILYLCAFEILPIFILIRFIQTFLI